MHKIITQKNIKTAVIVTMVVALVTCLCINFLSEGDISVFKRAILV